MIIVVQVMRGTVYNFCFSPVCLGRSNQAGSEGRGIRYACGEMINAKKNCKETSNLRCIRMNRSIIFKMIFGNLNVSV
jgi:hypothetical protein